MKIRKSF